MFLEEGKLNKLSLRLIEYAEDGMPTVSDTDVYSVQINPASFTVNKSISYQESSSQGTTEETAKFSRSGPSTISFEIMFDGTGVVPTANALDAIPLVGALVSKPDEPFDVDDQIKKFENTVYSFDGEVHQPNKVQISWGTMLFDGALSSISYSYTLFRADGTSLRAKANCTFKGTKSAKQIALTQNKTSPDLTHIRELKEGDTLPLLAHKVYGNVKLYLEVARVNKLINFRRLKSGTVIALPPVEKGVG